MTDRELLELAAKSAGIGLIAWTKFFDEWKFACNPCGEPWNPLIDDGDALRLLVLLGIEIRHVNGAAHAGRANHFWCTECWFPDGDKSKATRRAITRAAAELAKQEVKT